MDKRKIRIGSGGAISIDRSGTAVSKRKITIAAAAILLVSGTAWALMRNRPDPQVEKVKQLQAEAFKEGATPEQRRLVWQEMDKLSPEQRREVRQQGGQYFNQRIETYFTLPLAQRVAYLDQQIKEMEQWRKQMEARRGQEGGQGRGGGPQGNASGQGGGRNMSSESRAVRRNQRLDRSTPQQRAQRSAFFSDLQQRRAQLGLPPLNRGPGGRR